MAPSLRPNTTGDFSANHRIVPLWRTSDSPDTGETQVAYAVGDSIRTRREPVRRAALPALRWDRIIVLALNIGAWAVVWSLARHFLWR